MGRLLDLGPAVQLVEATEAHALELAANLRPQDAEELAAYGDLPAPVGIARSVAISNIAVALLIHGKVAALAGVVIGDAFLSDTGQAWLLTATPCSEYPREFVRACKAFMPMMQDASGCSELQNWVDERYTGALRLLDRLGFRRLGRAPVGPRGLPFVLVSRRV